MSEFADKILQACEGKDAKTPEQFRKELSAIIDQFYEPHSVTITRCELVKGIMEVDIVFPQIRYAQGRAE